MSAQCRRSKPNPLRPTFWDDISDTQCVTLEAYYSTVSKLPNRQQKLDLARQINLDALILNRWFQAHRNRDKAAEKRESQLD